MINTNLTNTLKNIIQSAGLYQSGRLYNSIEVDINISDKIYININTVDYFTYLNKKYKLTLALENSQAMQNEMEIIYTEIINNLLEDYANGKATQLELPIPVFLINGY